MSLRALVGLTAATMLASPRVQIVSAQTMHLKAPIYGITVDDISNVNAITASPTYLPYKPTMRMASDPGTTATQCCPALVKLHTVAYVMGEIMGPYYFPNGLRTRTSHINELMGTPKDVIDVWEIASKINGERLHTDLTGPNSVVASEKQDIDNMMAAAHDIVKTMDGLIAVAMYHNDGGKGTNYYELPMDLWHTQAQPYLLARVRQGADYTLFSYYPYQDYPGLNPTQANDFRPLESTFLVVKAGLGKIGASSISAPTLVQRNLPKSYYPVGTTTMVADQRFIGDCFWWNYAEQVPPCSTSSYWSLLSNIIKPLTVPQ